MATSFLVVKNNAVSSLASSITDVATSLTVASGEGSLFPSTFPFHISIEDEILSCTNRVSDVLTVTRAQQGTSGVAHDANVSVALNITAKSVTDLNTAVNTLENATVRRGQFFPVGHATGTGSVFPTAPYSRYSGAALGNASSQGNGYVTLAIPTQFTTLQKAVAVFIAAESGDANLRVNTNWGADGEAQNANTDSLSTSTVGVTADQMDEYDVSGALTGIAAGDRVGVNFERRGQDAADTITTFYFLGILIEYT